MTLTKSQIKKASQKIRHGEWSREIQDTVENFRDQKIPELCSLYIDIHRCLSRSSDKFFISGRVKRTKSIRRKIMRPPGGDLTRLADLIGLRVVLSGLAELEHSRAAIKSHFKIANEKNYLTAKDSGYRAVHLYVSSPSGEVEIQLRTLAQQLWANESEYFGERAKEGAGTTSETSYLAELSLACKSIDDGHEYKEEISGNIGASRGPILGRLPFLVDDFASISSSECVERLYVLVFDTLINEQVSLDGFEIKNAHAAVSHFRYKAKVLDENRYDVILLNSPSEPSLRVTHPIFFPSRAGY